MLLLIALCLAVGVGLKWYWDYRELHPSTDDAYVKAHIVDIAARVSGPVVAVHVAENDYVKAGAPLFAIGPATFDAAAAPAKIFAEGRHRVSEALVVETQFALSLRQRGLHFVGFSVERLEPRNGGVEAGERTVELDW